MPNQIYDVSLKYDDLKSFRALVKGRYLKWDVPENRDGDFSGFIVDVNVAQRFFSRPWVSLEAFISVHNLLNGAQYTNTMYPNPDRWVEGGVRASF